MLKKESDNTCKSPRNHCRVRVLSCSLESPRELYKKKKKKLMFRIHSWRLWLIGLGWNPGNRTAESSHVVLMDSQGWELLPSGNASYWMWRVAFILFFFFFWPNLAACRTSVPWPGPEPKPWQSKSGILTTRPLGNSESNDYSNINFQILVSHLSPPW